MPTQKSIKPGNMLTSEPRNYGQENIYVAGGTITAGQIVVVSETSAGHASVIAAEADTASHARGYLLVAQHAALSGEQVRCSEKDASRTLNTVGSAARALVYLSDTAGAISLSAGTATRVVGTVLTVGATGSVFLAPNAALGGTTLDLGGVADALILDADADTTISAAVDDQIDFKMGGVAGLAFKNATGMTNAAATDTAGQDIWVQTPDAGGTATAARVGGALDVRTGDGSASGGAFAGGAGGAVTVASGAGGANSGGASGQVGGAGGAINITTGVGGDTDSTGAHDAGAAGDLTLTGATGGDATAGTGNGGVGGALIGNAGDGGPSTGGTSGVGGAITYTAGNGAASDGNIAGGVGGAATLQSGDGGANTGGASGQAGGAAGTASIIGGAGGATDDTGTDNGGAGGGVAVTAGVGGDATGANASSDGGAGGDVTVTAGAGGAQSDGGGGDGGAGGSVLLRPGAGGTSAGANAGVPGQVLLGLSTGTGAWGFGAVRSTVADAGTLTDAEHRGMVIYQDASGGNVTCTTRTGTQLAAAFPDMTTGDAMLLFHSSNHASNTSTISGGASVTLVGSGAVTQTGGSYLLIQTGATTFDLVRVG